MAVPRLVVGVVALVAVLSCFTLSAEGEAPTGDITGFLGIGIGGRLLLRAPSGYLVSCRFPRGSLRFAAAFASHPPALT